MNKGAIILVGIVFFVIAAGAAAQDEFISYRLDGKEVRLTDVKLEWNADDYLTIEGKAVENVDFGANAHPRFREAEAGITFQLTPEDGSYVGTRKASSSDTLPVYLTWYKVGKEEGFVILEDHMADMDSSFQGQYFTVTVENFGGEGTLVKGTFSGRLKGGDDKLHTVDGGSFALRRRNVKG